MYTFIQSFESVAGHLELAILSRNGLELLSMRNQVLLNILVFFQQNSLEVFQNLYFQQVMGIVPQKPVIYWDFFDFSK